MLQVLVLCTSHPKGVHEITWAVAGPAADSRVCRTARPAGGWMMPMPERWMRACSHHGNNRELYSEQYRYT